MLPPSVTVRLQHLNAFDLHSIPNLTHIQTCMRINMFNLKIVGCVLILEGALSAARHCADFGGFSISTSYKH